MEESAHKESGKLEEIEEIKEEIEEIEEEIKSWEEGDSEKLKEYDDIIDDTNSTVKVFELEYSPSVVLKQCDPVAYRCGFADYSSERINELEERLAELKEQLEELEGGSVE